MIVSLVTPRAVAPPLSPPFQATQGGEYAVFPSCFVPPEQDDATWVRFLRALRKAGYDGVISIEHEDPRYDGEEGTSRSAAGLTRALSQMAEAA